MLINLKLIEGPWELGYSLDKHTLNSTYIGIDAYGHDRWDTTRSEAGEALYQLKYKQDTTQVDPIAQQLAISIVNKFPKIDFIVPMTPSTIRTVQPVLLVAESLAQKIGVSYIENFLIKYGTNKQLKDLTSKEEKLEALNKVMSINDSAINNGSWNVLIVDDLYDSGSSLEVACNLIKKNPKINKIFVASITRKK